ncbi:DUF421 domain-containing protein [Sporolactobacillus sp. THM19-2]|jgi:uncharacterized membrane protein YcaP (DUF421 family)|uniref:DUF421 domain-containing protein n=1 Tax=Sporolactobacillus sp. THM19-2 TaxID=2511171 RepID=UPI00101EEE1E|nr:DUF421 domain-containing protein [Sporolactobacillus sp. THM19-2]RYL94672.1 DUF421 domain-containing protein [Sporolactobacillus sp. THM19-2]
MHFLQIATELIIGFIALFLLTKILGKATLSQVTAFDFISAIVLGEFVGNALYDKEVGIGSVLFAIVLWGVMIYIVEWCTQKFRATRGFLEGKPSIVIRNGHLDREQMKKEKLDLNMLQNLLRQKDIFSIREVAYAILETDGSISALKKTRYDQPTSDMLKLPDKPVCLPVTLIMDGEVDWENLERSGLNEAWLAKELKKNHIDQFQDVFYCEWKKGEGIYLEKK